VEWMLQAHIGDHGLNIEEAARLCGCSKSTLRRALSKHETSFSEMIKKLRMKRASYALLDTEASISAIADELGYSDPTAFTRAFRSWYGTSPSRFRKDRADVQDRMSPT
jgi:AraC-like DNA-binding protein